MIRVSYSKAAVIRVEQLEDRCVLNGLPWPLNPIGGIFSTYGQFDNRTSIEPGKIHFHTGLDILAAEDQKVYAIEKGTVVTADGVSGYMSYVSIETNANTGWNYAHIAPVVTKGQNVAQGDLIGYVIKGPGQLLTHLHLDAAGGEDPSITTLLRPIEDPLARLVSVGDVTPPTMGDVFFLRGEDDNSSPHLLTGGSKPWIGGNRLLFQNEPERSKDHGYFKAVDYKDAWIVGHNAPAMTSAEVAVSGTSNIDITANATDKITAHDSRPLGVRSMEFSAKGDLLAKTIPTVRPFDFVGEFVRDPNRLPHQQNFDALYISDFTRVVYENDYTSPSNAAPPDTISYFHIVTNTDAGNPIVDFADRNRYWRSKVTQGSAWNNINSTEAASNATGSFPDDYYNIIVTARDAAGNGTMKLEKVLLDNWTQSMVCLAKDAPGGGLDCQVTGKQFPPNVSVPIWAWPIGVPLVEGDLLPPNATLVATAYTDDDGTFYKEFTYDDSVGKVLIADYVSDGIFQPRLDAQCFALLWEDPMGMRAGPKPTISALSAISAPATGNGSSNEPVEPSATPVSLLVEGEVTVGSASQESVEVVGVGIQPFDSVNADPLDPSDPFAWLA